MPVDYRLLPTSKLQSTHEALKIHAEESGDKAEILYVQLQQAIDNKEDKATVKELRNKEEKAAKEAVTSKINRDRAAEELSLRLG